MPRAAVRRCGPAFRRSGRRAGLPANAAHFLLLAWSASRSTTVRGRGGVGRPTAANDAPLPLGKHATGEAQILAEEPLILLDKHPSSAPIKEYGLAGRG
jgi:hypothetical protein